jgi:hypothetical protein
VVKSLRPTAGATPSEKAAAFGKMGETLRELSKAGSIFAGNSLAKCLLHPDGMCPLYWQDPPTTVSERPLTMNVSGPMCTPFSPFGKQDCYSNEHMESFYIWQEGVAARRYDAATLENSVKFPVELFEGRMSENAVVVYARFGPPDIARQVRLASFMAHGSR